VLLQVLLLGRTALAYNEAVNDKVKVAADNSRMRQRLANTLFAQIFAGSPRERAGWLGWLLTGMAWITLAIAPILILLAFQFMFLPYHSHLATWTHRLTILIELMAIFWFWPLVTDPRRDFEWFKMRKQLKRAVSLPRWLLSPSDGRRFQWYRLQPSALPFCSCFLFVLVSLSVASFPGEPHVNVFTAQPIDSVQCDRWLHQAFARGDLRFDRLIVPRVDVVDDEKLKKIIEATSDRKLAPSQGERTRDFRNRDFNCADMSFADLRRVDLTNARLTAARLRQADLQGASLNRAELQFAYLNEVDLRGASLQDAMLQGASLSYAQLQGASLIGTLLQGASLDRAEFQGAHLYGTNLQGAFIDGTQLQGALLQNARLQGASLNKAQLQGALLDGAQLQGASLESAYLQGALLDRANMDYSVVSGAWIWQASMAACKKARTLKPTYDAVVGSTSVEGKVVSYPATTQDIAKFIEYSVAGIPDPITRKRITERMLNRLDSAKIDTAVIDLWRDCENITSGVSQAAFDDGHVALLRKLVCNATFAHASLAYGVARNWIFSHQRPEFSTRLARGLLGEDGDNCAATAYFDDWTKGRLRAFAGPAIRRFK
jgi:uncharacterized protein YjbI with pentapeptide repeats